MAYQMGTHTSQCPPAEVAGEATDYMVYMHFILNTDQTPVYFAMSAKQTLELIGKKTIHIRTMADDTKRATIVVTIAADGTLLLAMVVFKGTVRAMIAMHELGTYPTTNHYR